MISYLHIICSTPKAQKCRVVVKRQLCNILSPPLEIQTKIVAILDQFDALTQSISQGLPREISLRRRQYKYYREQLLNFAPAA
ncbi:restriction endonuclease subunit S [Neisseria sp. 19428wB4_WF04]|nr:restriction endonuclease subunit S [Neisseria sp. 19428wB4_WF04]TFU39232.1 restriction endonuclease subunit S [Neisseria sp. WF04]